MKPTVSIAMTTFNGVAYIARQLASIAEQTYQPLEIIISDDGSTDGTLQELELLQKKFPFKLFTRSVPLGVNANLAFTLQQCGGDLIAIADQDDIWELDKIEVLVAAVGQHDAVFSDSLLIDENDRSLGMTMMKFLLKGREPKVGTEPLYFILQNVVSGHALLFRRELLNYALPFVNDFYYDQQIAIVASLGNGIAYLNRPLVLHRQHGSNTCNHLLTKTSNKSGSRLSRAARMAIQLRVGVKYMLQVFERTGGDKRVRQVRRLSRLLDVNNFLGRCELFFWLIRNRKKIFPYDSLWRSFKLARRVIIGLRK